MASNQKVYKTKIAQHEILQKKTSEPNLEYDFLFFDHPYPLVPYPTLFHYVIYGLYLIYMFFKIKHNHIFSNFDCINFERKSGPILVLGGLVTNYQIS